MPIPNAEFAFIPSGKLSHYLLNSGHPVGGSKARWFLSLGYHPEKPDQLEADLLAIVRNSSEYEDEPAAFGVKYIVRGRLESPRGRLALIRTVWLTETGVPQPRLITAYPDKEQTDA